MVSKSRLGEAAEEGELELGSKVLGNAPLTTRERIRRDRELHRLGLNLVERIPKDVLIDLVQVCKPCSSSLCESVFNYCCASDFLLACSVQSASVCNASDGGTHLGLSNIVNSEQVIGRRPHVWAVKTEKASEARVQCMQDVCISLEVADPTSLSAAISKVLRVIATLPRLERFVGEVCEVPHSCIIHSSPHSCIHSLIRPSIQYVFCLGSHSFSPE